MPIIQLFPVIACKIISNFPNFRLLIMLLNGWWPPIFFLCTWIKVKIHKKWENSIIYFLDPQITLIPLITTFKCLCDSLYFSHFISFYFLFFFKGCTRLAAASDKVYQLLAQGRWFSPGTPASSTTKTGRHDIDTIT